MERKVICPWIARRLLLCPKQIFRTKTITQNKNTGIHTDFDGQRFILNISLACFIFDNLIDYNFIQLRAHVDWHVMWQLDNTDFLFLVMQKKQTFLFTRTFPLLTSIQAFYPNPIFTYFLKDFLRVLGTAYWFYLQ